LSGSASAIIFSFIFGWLPGQGTLPVVKAILPPVVKPRAIQRKPEPSSEDELYERAMRPRDPTEQMADINEFAKSTPPSREARQAVQMLLEKLVFELEDERQAALFSRCLVQAAKPRDNAKALAAYRGCMEQVLRPKKPPPPPKAPPKKRSPPPLPPKPRKEADVVPM
jgi:hypothetical protein